MGNLLVRSVSGCLPFVGQGVEVDLQPVGFGDSWAGSRPTAFGSTNAQSGLSGYDPFAVTRFAGGTGHSKCMVDLPPLESSKIYVILNTEGDDVCH